MITISPTNFKIKQGGTFVAPEQVYRKISGVMVPLLGGGGGGAGDQFEIEFEDFELSGDTFWLFGDTNVGYSGAGYLRASTQQFSTTPPATMIASYEVDVDASGTFELWARIWAADATSDSIFWRIPEASPTFLRFNTASGASWQWNLISGSIASPAGTVSIEIAIRESDCNVDKVVYQRSTYPDPS